MGLFESLPDVAAEPALETAAQRVADLVRRKLAARAALVHVFDPIAGEYVLTAASGAYDRALIGTRIPASDPELLRALMSAASIIVDAGPRGNLETSRWVSLQPKRCVLVAPACIDGQAYGAIELCDPLDRGRFDTEDEHALTYVGERWAELVAEREPH
jgi:GAF domain-containing protein